MSIYEATNLSSLGVGFILIMGILVLILPRRIAFIPIIITTCYITLGQQLLISVFHFSALRIVVVFAWLRLFARGEIFALKLNKVDKAFICWVISSFVIYNLRLQTSEALVNRLGFFYNTIGIYFLFRYYIRDLKDIERVLVSLAIFIIPLAIAMLIEYSTGRNIFAVFGGVSEISEIREGRIRCQGSFRHPILAGTFGAVILPVLSAIWFKGKNFKLFATAGVVSATTIMVTSASSGPLMAYISGVAGLLVWYLRNHMRVIRWGILFTLISLHLIMKAPVWYLMSRISDLLGGTGWHRSYLIDQAIAHFDDWWLLGTNYTGDWFPYALGIDPTKADITNEFIGEGVAGGLLTMILYIVVIIYCFRMVGLSLKVMKESPFAEKLIVWSLGASLLAHVIAQMSVGYFDQIIVIWYLLLAMISTVGSSLDVQNGIENNDRGWQGPLSNFA